VEDAADSVAAVDSEGVEIGDGCWQRPERSGLFEGSVGTVLVVMGLVVAEDFEQVALVPDQGSVD
jgi:hypothetical protein